MAAVPDLISLAFAEKDNHGELMIVWVYPKIETACRELVLTKCESVISEDETIALWFGQFQRLWHYIVATSVKGSGTLDKVSDVYAIVQAKNFNPELYHALGKVCLQEYIKSASPVNSLLNYLSVFTKGVCKMEDGSNFVVSEFPVKRAYLKTCLKETVSLFGMEVILLYTALLLKRRIVVYSSKLSTLLDVCRSLPALVIHRLNWNIVFPLLQPSQEELEEVAQQRSYVVGVTDPTYINRTDLYDIFVNVSDCEIEINPQSKEYFQMGKFHKDLAKFMVETSNDEELSDQDMIKELKRRTIDVITNLKSLDTENPDNPKISLAMLQERKLTPTMQMFLFNLALAEGLDKA